MAHPRGASALERGVGERIFTELALDQTAMRQCGRYAEAALSRGVFND